MYTLAVLEPGSFAAHADAMTPAPRRRAMLGRKLKFFYFTFFSFY
jgi:hypothetical protein